MDEQMSTCEHLPDLPDLRPPEQLALFTYSCLLAAGQIQIVSVADLLSYISQYIQNTWGVYIEPMPWIFVGVTAQATRLYFDPTRSSLACFVNIAPTGLKLRR
jgi:hypothetical protein